MACALIARGIVHKLWHTSAGAATLPALGATPLPPVGPSALTQRLLACRSSLEDAQMPAPQVAGARAVLGQAVRATQAVEPHHQAAKEFFKEVSRGVWDRAAA